MVKLQLKKNSKDRVSRGAEEVTNVIIEIKVNLEMKLKRNLDSKRYVN